MKSSCAVLVITVVSLLFAGCTFSGQFKDQDKEVSIEVGRPEDGPITEM